MFSFTARRQCKNAVYNCLLHLGLKIASRGSDVLLYGYEMVVFVLSRHSQTKCIESCNTRESGAVVVYQ